MNKTTKYWITFYSPGSFTTHTHTEPRASLPAPQEVEFPENAYAFTMHRQDVIADGDDTFEGKAVQIGPTYYHPDSKIETLAEVRLNQNASGILVSNMECNGWKSVVWSRWGTWPQPYRAKSMKIVPRKP